MIPSLLATRSVVTLVFRSFGAFSGSSKARLSMISALRWAPACFATWMFEGDQRPGMVRLRENREYIREVAVKLIEEKRQELKDGNPRRDVLSLLGSSCVALVGLGSRCDIELVSQGKFCATTRIATER